MQFGAAFGRSPLARIGLAALIAAGVLLWNVAARADLTFAQWANLPTDRRAIYATGVLETMNVLALLNGNLDRWDACLTKIKLSAKDVSAEAVDFAGKHNFQTQAPPAVIMAYMNQKCGFSFLTGK